MVSVPIVVEGKKKVTLITASAMDELTNVPKMAFKEKLFCNLS